MKKLNKYQQKWVDALRSGEYQQTKLGALHLKTDGFCCLGVACEILSEDANLKEEWITDHVGKQRKSYGGQIDSLPNKVAALLGITNEGECARYNLCYNEMSFDNLIEINDDTDADFNDIADIIEKNIKEGNL